MIHEAADSYCHHPVDDIEPIPDPGEDPATEVVRQLILGMFSARIPGDAATREIRLLEAGYRNFVALALILNPSIANPSGAPLRFLAAEIGVSGAALSKLMVAWSKRLGIIGAGMKSAEAREAYRERAKKRAKGRGACVNQTKRIGELYSNPHQEELSQKMISNALGKLRIDEAGNVTAKYAAHRQRNAHLSGVWTTVERRVLAHHGLIDEDCELTAAGRERLAEVKAPSPPL